MSLAVLRGGVTRLTLDEVWAEAETIGEVSVDSGWFDGPYRGRIIHKSGASRVYTYGNGKTPVDALMAAIVEARRIGGQR